MDFEPQKFFVGLVDFFSILLPGAFLTFLLNLEAARTPWVMEKIPAFEGAKGWVAFLVASYLLGHLAFLLGSWLDELYDWLRNRTINTQIKELGRRDKLLGWWVRWPVRLVFKRERNLAVDRVGTIKRQALAPLQAKNEINNFQWSKAWLTKESPESLAVVQRFEADSKFFRCFVIVLIVLLLWTWRWWEGKLAIVGAVILPFAIWRYMEQRYKATNQAYWSVITLTARNKVTIEPKPPADPTFTHAGGVVFRKPWFGKVQYLLVESTGYPIEWVLPKGKIEEDEDAHETAVREVHEETGVWALIWNDLGKLTFSHKSKTVTARIFLMQRAGRGFRSDPSRKRKWLTLDKAKRLASHSETRKLLELAEQYRLRGRQKPTLTSTQEKPK